MLRFISLVFVFWVSLFAHAQLTIGSSGVGNAVSSIITTSEPWTFTLDSSMPATAHLYDAASNESVREIHTNEVIEGGSFYIYVITEGEWNLVMTAIGANGIAATAQVSEIETLTPEQRCELIAEEAIDVEAWQFDGENGDCIIYANAEIFSADDLILTIGSRWAQLDINDGVFGNIKIKVNTSMIPIDIYIGDDQEFESYTYQPSSNTFSQVADLDCGDFPNRAAAQAALAGGDPHGLDGDGDGKACEWGTREERTTTNSSSPIIGAGSNCHWVSGYRRSNGTYVSGYRRCR